MESEAFYHKHAPPFSTIYHQKLKQEYDQVTKDIVLRNWRVILSSIHIDNQNTIDVLNPNILPDQKIPLLVSSVSNLFSHIYGNIPKFAENVLKNKNDHYVALAISSLFGFYSSYEHVHLSFNFFSELIKNVKKDKFNNIEPLLEPFFASTCLYNYFESSLTQFFDYINYDILQFDKPNSFDYSNFLIECFVSNVPLIPAKHREILNLMNQKFGSEETKQFIFAKILKPQILKWYEYIGISNSIGKFENFECSKILAEILNGKKSVFDVPHQYYMHDYTFIYNLVSKSDIKTLIKLTNHNIKNIDIDKNSLFWIRCHINEFDGLYMKNYLSKDESLFISKDKFKMTDTKTDTTDLNYIKWLKILDDNKDSNCDLTKYVYQNLLIKPFEMFIMLKNELKPIKSWLEISKLNEFINLLPSAKNMFLKCQNFYEKMYDNSTFLSSFPLIKRYLYLLDVQKYTSSIVDCYKKEIDNIIGISSQIIHQKINKDIYINKDILNTNHLFTTIKHNDLPYQFTILLRGLTNINQISYDFKNVDEYDREEKNKMLIKFAISESNASMILYAYLLIEHFCVADNNFTQLCTKHELQMWLNMQNVIRNIIYFDIDNGQKYNTLVEKLSSKRCIKTKYFQIKQ